MAKVHKKNKSKKASKIETKNKSQEQKSKNKIVKPTVDLPEKNSKQNEVQNKSDLKDVLDKDVVSKEKTAELRQVKQEYRQEDRQEEKLTEKKPEAKKPGVLVVRTESIISLLIGILLIGLVFTFSLYVIPQVILQNTDDAIALRKKQENERLAKEKQEKIQKQIEEENKVLRFDKQVIALEIENFGQLKIKMLEEIAPKTTENFIRLVHRGYYNGTVFHRMVKAEGFNVIQGGDPTATGTGGESAFGNTIPDELWKVKPEFDPQTGLLTNEPEFQSSEYYRNFNKETGQVTYPKGAILMAKTAAPDSATSQFFINLTDTTLPAQYTVFGIVTEDSLPILDKIFQEVEPQTPVSSAQDNQMINIPKDGKPNKELKITEAKILSS